MGTVLWEIQFVAYFYSYSKLQKANLRLYILLMCGICISNGL